MWREGNALPPHDPGMSGPDVSPAPTVTPSYSPFAAATVDGFGETTFADTKVSAALEMLIATTAPLAPAGSPFVAERERPEQAVVDLGGEHLRDHVARARRRTHRSPRAGPAPPGRRRSRTGRESLPLRYSLEKLSANSLRDADERLDRLAGDRRVHVRRRRACAVDRRLGVEPVRRQQLDAPSFGPSTATLSLISWAPFSSIRPPMKTPSAPVASIFLYRASYEDAFGSNASKPGDLDPERLRRVPEVRRDAEAVGLLVVEDEDAS